MKLKIIVLLLLQTPGFAHWIERKAEGWAWYEDQKKTEKEPEQRPPSEELAMRSKALEDKLANAILSPTPASVLAYLEEQRKWLNLSTEFSHVWSQLLLRHPHLDNTTQVPVSQYGLQIYTQLLQEKKESLLTQLAQEYGLFFFYEGDNVTSKVQK
jgi:conjugal transfer pilus assembly protein TraF